MAKFYTGRDGRLLIDGTQQVKVTNWSLTGSLEVLETTTLGDNERSYVPGVQEFSGSATLLYYRFPDPNNPGQKLNHAATALQKVLNTTGVQSTDTVVMLLRFVEGGNNYEVELKAYITSVSISANVGEVSSAQISFQGTEALQGVTI